MNTSLYYYIKRRKKKLTRCLFLIVFLLLISPVLKKHKKIISKDDYHSENKTETCTALFVVLHFRIIDENQSPIQITETIIKHIKSKLESYTNTSHRYMFVDQRISENGLPQSLQDSAYYIQGPSERRGQCGYVWGFDSNDEEVRYDTCGETKMSNSWKFCKLNLHLFDEDATQKASTYYDKHCVPNLAASWPLQSVDKCTSNGQADMTVWVNYARNLDKNLLNNNFSEYLEYTINAWQVLGLVVEYDKDLLQTSFSVLSSQKTIENTIEGVVLDQDIPSTANVPKTTMEIETAAVAQPAFTSDAKSSTNSVRTDTYQQLFAIPGRTTTLVQLEKLYFSQHAALKHSPTTQASQITSIISQQEPTAYVKTYTTSTLLPGNTASVKILSNKFSTTASKAIPLTQSTTFSTPSTDDVQLFATPLDMPEETHPFVLAAKGNEVFNEQIYNEMVKKLYPELFSETGYLTSPDKMPEPNEGSGMMLPDDMQHTAIMIDSSNTEVSRESPTTDEPRTNADETMVNGLSQSNQKEYVSTLANLKVMDDIIALRDLINKIYGVELDNLPVPFDRLLSQIHNATDHTHVDLSNTELKEENNQTDVAYPTNNSVLVQFDNKDNSEVDNFSSSLVTSEMYTIETMTEPPNETTDTTTIDTQDKYATPSSGFDTRKPIAATLQGIDLSNPKNVTTLTDLQQQNAQLVAPKHVDDSQHAILLESSTPVTFVTTTEGKEIIQTSTVLTNLNTQVAPILQTTHDSNFATPSLGTASANNLTPFESTLVSEKSTIHKTNHLRLTAPTRSDNKFSSNTTSSITYPFRSTNLGETYSEHDIRIDEWYKTTTLQAPATTEHSDLEKTSTTNIDETTSNLVNTPAKVVQAKVPSSLDIDIPQYSASHEDATPTTFFELYTTHFGPTVTSKIKDIKGPKTGVQYQSVVGGGAPGSTAETKAPLPHSTVQSDITTNDFIDENLYLTFSATPSVKNDEENLSESQKANSTPSSYRAITIDGTRTTNADNSLSNTESGSGLNQDMTIIASNQSKSDALILEDVTSISPFVPKLPLTTNANDITLNIPGSSPSSLDVIDNSRTGSGFNKNISEAQEDSTWHNPVFNVNNPTQDTENSTTIAFGILDVAHTSYPGDTTPSNSNSNSDKSESNLPNSSTDTIVQLSTNWKSTPTDFTESSNGITGGSSYITIENPKSTTVSFTDDTTSSKTDSSELRNAGIANNDVTCVSTTLGDIGSTSIEDRGSTVISTTPGDKNTKSSVEKGAMTVSFTDGTSSRKTTGSDLGSAYTADHDANSVSTTLGDIGSTSIEDRGSTVISTTPGDKNTKSSVEKGATTVSFTDGTTSRKTTGSDLGSADTADHDSNSASTTMGDIGSTSIEDYGSTVISTTLGDKNTTSSIEKEAISVSITPEDKGSPSLVGRGSAFIPTIMIEKGTTSIADHDAASVLTTPSGKGNPSIAVYNAASISTTLEDTVASTLQMNYNPLKNAASALSTDIVNGTPTPENKEAAKKLSSTSLSSNMIIYLSKPYTISNAQPSTFPSVIAPIIDVTSATVGKWFEYNLPATWEEILKDNETFITVSLSTVENVQNFGNQLVEERWLRYHRGFKILCGVPIGKNGTDVSQISTFIIQIITKSYVLKQVTLHVSLYPMLPAAIPNFIVELDMNRKPSDKNTLDADFSDKNPAAFVQQLTSYLQEKDPLLRHSSINLMQFNYVLNPRKKRSLISSIKALWNVENMTLNEFNMTFGETLMDSVNGYVAHHFFLAMLPQFIVNQVNIKSSSSHHLSSNKSPQLHIEQQENIVHTVMPPILIGVFIVILCVVLIKLCKKKRPMYYIAERFQDRTFGPNRKPVYLDEEIEMNNLRPSRARIMLGDILHENQTSINSPMEMNIDRTQTGTVISRSSETTLSRASSQRDSEDGYYSFTHGSFHLRDM